MSMAYIRKRYSVPAKRGQLMTFNGRRARITSAHGAHFYIRMEESGRRVGPFHPSDADLRYLDESGEVICNPALCAKCGERDRQYYDLCGPCLPPSYKLIVGFK